MLSLSLETGSRGEVKWGWVGGVSILANGLPGPPLPVAAHTYAVRLYTERDTRFVRGLRVWCKTTLHTLPTLANEHKYANKHGKLTSGAT